MIIFAEQFVKDVEKRFAALGIRNVSVSITDVRKVNGMIQTIKIQFKDLHFLDRPVAVTIDLNHLAESLSLNASYEQMINTTVSIIQKRCTSSASEINVCYNYETAKDHFIIQIISREANVALLEDVPHFIIEDMAVICRVELASNEEETSTVVVTKNMLDAWNITAKQLFTDAIQNSQKMKPALLDGLGEMLVGIGMMDSSEVDASLDELFWVGHTNSINYGASVLVYPGFLDQASKKIGGSFYILPCSVHELILVKDLGGIINYNDLLEMVKMVNNKEVQPEEKLTDNVYHYDEKTGVFETAEKYAMR